MKLIRIAASFMAMASAACAYAQISLEECIRKAYVNYPQIKEFELIRKSLSYDLSSTGLSWVPQVSVSGKATWQSDVVEMPFEFNGYTFDIPHDQYSIVADVSQQLWDGGVTASKKMAAEAGAEVKLRQLEVNLYTIRSRVRNLYLGIILIDKQLEINDILLKNLERNRSEVETLVESGVAMPGDLDLISVNILGCEQQHAALAADRKAYVQMLGLLTGEPMEGKELVEPETDIPGEDVVSRPELALYDAQSEQAKVQYRQFNTAISPKFNLTLQGGYGRPGLNMLSGKFEPYFVAGVRMQWNFGALYTLRNDRRKVETDAARINTARESFLLNTSVEALQKRSEIEKARDVLERDDKIIGLRKNICETGRRQYLEGTLKMNDYLDMMDEEYKAMLNKSVHTVQLMMAIYDLKDTLGDVGQWTE